jgi:hypothetical protein
MPTSNRSKNILKKLRKNGSPLLLNNKENSQKQKNFYACLETLYDEADCESNKLNKLIVTKRNSLDLNCLPEEMINNILEYLPIDKRIEIIKHKYSKKTVQRKLENIHKTDENYKKLFKCASIAKEVLEFVLKSESDVFKNFTLYATEKFKKETELNTYSSYYKENFTKIILAAMKHYTRFYQEIDTSLSRLIKSIVTTNCDPYYYYFNIIWIII